MGPAVSAATPSLARRRNWLELRKPLGLPEVLGLGFAVWVVFFGVWQIAVSVGWAPPLLLPAPWAVVVALDRLIVDEGFLVDVAISVYRILASFAAAAVVAVPLGILMGSFRSVEAFFTRSRTSPSELRSSNTTTRMMRCATSVMCTLSRSP